MKKVLKKLDIVSFALYGAVLVGIWTLIFGLYIWIWGWAFGAQSWFIDMNLGSWASYSFQTFLYIVGRMFINAIAGAISGAIFALVYNLAADIMGGVKYEVEDVKESSKSVK